jgi:hypothetical protein
MDTEFRIAAEAAARAELLIDAKAVAGGSAMSPGLRSPAQGGPRSSIRLAVPILRSTMASWIIGEVAGERGHDKNKLRRDHHGPGTQLYRGPIQPDLTILGAGSGLRLSERVEPMAAMCRLRHRMARTGRG